MTIIAQDSDNKVKLFKFLTKLTPDELDFIKNRSTVMLQELDLEEETAEYKDWYDKKVQEG